jgi:hypothetical protein
MWACLWASSVQSKGFFNRFPVAAGLGWIACDPPATPFLTRPFVRRAAIHFVRTGPTTPIPGLYACGDSTFPGIGLPAVAASGAICANTLVPVRHIHTPPRPHTRTRVPRGHAHVPAPA